MWQRISIRHQRRRSDYPVLMRFHNGTIDPVGKAKIICIHDQAAHAVSLTSYE
jgi:hypothetical protein